MQPISTTRALRGEPVSLVEEAAGAEWLRAGTLHWAEEGKQRVVVTDRAVLRGTDALVFERRLCRR